MTIPPKVSVLMITYNHAKFIAQAIESVLMQEVNFAFELVVGEDNSSDDTRRVVEEYQRRYPDTIRLIPRERNLSSGNFTDTYALCRGEYIAVLEGDDYWTSSAKLQVQVDALDSHPEWVLCFHPVRVVSEDANKPTYRFPDRLKKEVFTLDDLLRANFIPTASVIFRNRVVTTFPDWYAALAMGDWPLFILLAQHGHLGYLDRVMATYRTHDGGIWSSKDDLFRTERSLEMLGQIRQILDDDRRARLTDQIVNDYIDLVDEQLKRGRVSKARSTLWGLLRRESVLRRGFPHKEVVRVAVEIDAPIVLRLVRWIRKYTRPGRG